MEQTLVRGGYGIACSSSRKTIASSAELQCSVLPSRPVVYLAFGPGPLRPSVCYSERRRSLSISFGFLNLRVGRNDSRLSRLQSTMATEASGEHVPVKTMKVVDHAVLFKMMDTFDEFQEKEMLDGLHTLQYAIKDIISQSLGRLTQKSPLGFTHGLFTRFKSVKALQDYLVHEKKVEVAEKLIIPFFSEAHGIAMVDFETEIENDMEAVFRRGDKFESGVEHFAFFKFKDGTAPNVVEECLSLMKASGVKFGAGVVQTTIGSNIEPRTTAYFSHGIVTRFESESAYEEFRKFMWGEPDWAQVKDVTENFVEGAYNVTPIGNKLM